MSPLNYTLSKNILHENFHDILTFAVDYINGHYLQYQGTNQIYKFMPAHTVRKMLSLERSSFPNFKHNVILLL